MLNEPTTTYRLQFRPEFTLDDAVGIVDYLADLGVSHIYASSYLQAGPGSTHGYDVTDPRHISSELGGPEALARFDSALKGRSLGQLLDIVPNHMSVRARNNPWWWDVLENGSLSRYAGYFDIEWNPAQGRLKNKILLPVLAEHYGQALESGKLKLARERGSFVVQYMDRVYPASPDSLTGVLVAAAKRANSDDLAFIADVISGLTPSLKASRAEIMNRLNRDKRFLRSLIKNLCEQQPAVAESIDEVIKVLNSDPGALDALLEKQHYRLTHWRAARHELNFRRFFAINSMVALRMEDPAVFQDAHALVLNLVNEGMVQHLRVDHPDGLRDPEEYFTRLRDLAPNAWIIAEKVLGLSEHLRESWPIDGTTGYDFLNKLNGLFVNADAEAALTKIYADSTGEQTDCGRVIHDNKARMLSELLDSDVSRLTNLAVQVCERNRCCRDYTRFEIHEAITELAASFPVYRTYVRTKAGKITEEDIQRVDDAVVASRRNRPDIDSGVFDLLRRLLCLQLQGDTESEFVMRFQQLTPPAMAKGVEDTVFYRYNRLISINEVGGDPGSFGISIDAFHAALVRAQDCWPYSMLATSTHDTKRSEDVRARINVLSEIPDEWGAAVKKWFALNEKHRSEGMPDRNTEYFLYQTLVGAWPLETDRVLSTMEKSVREAGAYTNWTEPNQNFEDALKEFIQSILSDNKFLNSLKSFLKHVVEPGRINSLSQLLIKLTAPGIPDIYQGNEVWDLSLVDPDNRRPVDYAARRRLLADLEKAPPEDILNRMDEGLPKLWVTRQALALRHKSPEYFGKNSKYTPLFAKGSKANHAVAFMRADSVITIVTRCSIGLANDWQDTVLDLPENRWKNELTGETIEGNSSTSLTDLLAKFPVALLSRLE